LKNIKVNFNILPGLHNHHSWISLNHSDQFWRVEWVRFPTPTSLKQLEDVPREKLYRKFR
jgi:hypothetical protein